MCLSRACCEFDVARAVRAAMVNGADTAETDSDTEAAQEVAQEALGLGGENFAAGAGSAALQVRACTVS